MYLCYNNAVMPGEREQTPLFTPTLLRFRASLPLENRLREFLNPRAQRALIERKGRIKLISRHVKNLDLGVGIDGVGEHAREFRSYKQRVDNQASHHTFQLDKAVIKDQEVEDGLELKFTINFATNSEKALIIAPPFLSKSSSKPFEIYAALPEKALGDERSIEQAYETLELSMGKGLSGIPNAPWDMNVRDVRIEHTSIEQPGDEQ